MIQLECLALFNNTDLHSDLITYCERGGMPYMVFEDWESILATTKDIVAGKISVKNAAVNK
jgi:2-hydroxy-3-keto-5-methylthiopentenyl-1-phosphate phosphatase